MKRYLKMVIVKNIYRFFILCVYSALANSPFKTFRVGTVAVGCGSGFHRRMAEGKK